MGILVRDASGKDVTNREPRKEKMVMFWCVGCGARIQGPRELSSHPVDDKECGPLQYLRDLGPQEGF